MPTPAPLPSSIPMRRVWALGALILIAVPGFALSQSSRKPTRVEAPTFAPGVFDAVFYADPVSMLRGDPPSASGASDAPRPLKAPSKDAAPSATVDADEFDWSRVAAAATLEDLIKAAGIRLDALVTTPTAFKGGGFMEVRKEFSLLAVLFAVIERYPGDVRWKESATTARYRFARAAANAKVASDQVYQEAKQRMLDLDDLLNGETLTGGNAPPVEWSQLTDRVPLMQLLSWAHEEQLSKQVADANRFADQRASIVRFAELIAVLGHVAIADGMPDADDSDYVGYSQEMLVQARDIAAAARSDDPSRAREAAARLGQSCAACHENFR